MTYPIRDAVHADLPAIRDIYNDAVLNTTAIWNEQAVDLGNRQAWFSARQAQGYPILVIVDGENNALHLVTGDRSMVSATPSSTRCTCAATSAAMASDRN